MSHYEQRLEQDLTRIRDRLRAVAGRIEKALERSVHALLTRDRRLAYEVILGDLAINREVRAIDRLCHAFVARHLPSAGHLRFVSAVLRLNVELERIGDYAVTISREAVQLSAPPDNTVARDLELLSQQARAAFAQAVASFDDANAEQARAIKAMVQNLGSTHDKVFADLLHQGEKGTRPLKDLFALLAAFVRLKRVSDQAKNICEETVFAVTGETKAPKLYRVLFADAGNDLASQMAAAIAGKLFPDSGRYDSAGWAPAAAVAAGLVAFLDRHGIDLTAARPRRLEVSREALAPYHVLVGVGGDVFEHLPTIPYQLVIQQWELPAAAADDDEALSALYRELAHRVRELVEALRGEEAP